MKRWERAIAGSAMVFFSTFAVGKPPASERAVQACIDDAAIAFSIAAPLLAPLRKSMPMASQRDLCKGRSGG